MTNRTDQNVVLLKQCLQGNAMAQKMVYERYKDAMFNVSIRIVNQREDAEDVLQDSFVTAFQTLHKVLDLNAFGGWLKRIVINKSLNSLKKKRLKYTDMEYDLPQIQEEDSAEEPNWKSFTIQSIKEGIKKLPDGYRTVLTLYMFEDFSHKEIAETLKITESTSKSQLNRAKKKLKETLLAQ